MFKQQKKGTCRVERGKYPKHKKKIVDVYYSRYVLTMQGGGDIFDKRILD